ncbi:hypothetical protein Baya_13722 [Bagarius yarrelli]|uniref:Uncharacterized protein n=1 Tax=Bagarius yarrelli TaxID=175774 RepID=A0A556V6X1_BAGYA|nr:hypothetical protein Baya_13722 [Bagarius yarrelli]
MTKLQTLNELKHLKDSRFGQPYPRHSLKLLYWFANDFVNYDGCKNLCWCYDPEEERFGFHRFENRPESNGEKRLPDVNMEYYEVGNLRKSGADELPDYVRDVYNRNPYHCERNMDRIIVSVDDECIDRVYVTEHKRWHAGFNKDATYRISRGLTEAIRKLSLKDFLLQTGYSIQPEESDQSSTDDDDDDDDDSYKLYSLV